MNFNNISIKRKITYLYLPFVVLPLLLFFFFSTNLYEASIITRSQESMEDSNILISDRIDDILSEAESAATYLTISINTLINNQAYQGRLSDDIQLYNLISNELSYAILINKHIDSIAFYDVNQTLYYTDHRLGVGKEKIEDYSLSKSLLTSAGNNLWGKMTRRDFLVKSPDQPVMTLGKKVWNINTGETIGYLYINISDQTIKSVFESQISDYYIYQGDKLLTSLVDNEDTGLERHEVAELLADTNLSNVIRKSPRKYLISKIDIDRVDWTLISQTNLEDVTTDLDNLLLILSFILIAILIMNVLISVVLNRMITSPIVRLREGLEEISKGNFDYRFAMKTNDEIGVFASSFNHMSEQIRNLLSQVELEEEQKRIFELALIQQQIKPHFLYNTLDIILKLSEMGQSRKAQKVTKRLADYYKHSLSGGSDVVSLENEIKITRDYLELQKIRYSDILDYDIDLKNDMSDRVIPKLTLQPLVENAIYHGLKYKESPGKIIISDEMTEDDYYIIVSDDGVGISEEGLAAMHLYLEENEFDYNKEISESFGMRNVNYRLKLFFGIKYGLDMTSEINVGTEVRIKLPRYKKYD
ncbi:HAMP domain-containing protein [Acidaminobacter sp. JC074]|uniref:sensor histidine kinase n=1 Tax=Acidaminobacter sp. JC074 TaxID=2530199 RepID=UPI001F10275C|nr:histidine kinase [Acidaminobacter sp. JC074]MCH4886531.1 HAMP domain-containing protein [Acidaminobacter sp. JC074]